MTDQPVPAPAEAPPLYNYRIITLAGRIFDVGSANDWVAFWSVIKRDGYMVAPKGFVPYHAINSIEPLDTPVPTAEIVKLVQNGHPPKP